MQMRGPCDGSPRRRAGSTYGLFARMLHCRRGAQSGTGGSTPRTLEGPRNMRPLPVPVPPQLEEAIGLPDTAARWVSLHWTPPGDTVVHDDGRTSGTGHGWGWLAWARHPAVAPHLAPYDLGSSEEEGT